MKITRLITCFDKKTEEIIKEYNIDHINYEVLKGIMKPRKNDPLMYDPYTLTKNKAKKLSQHIDLNLDFNKYIYQVDCFQV